MAELCGAPRSTGTRFDMEFPDKIIGVTHIQISKIEVKGEEYPLDNIMNIQALKEWFYGQPCQNLMIAPLSSSLLKRRYVSLQNEWMNEWYMTESK